MINMDWICNSCSYIHKNHPIGICGNTLPIISYDLFRRKYDINITNEKIEELLDEYPSIYDIDNCSTYTTCQSRSFSINISNISIRQRQQLNINQSNMIDLNINNLQSIFSNLNISNNMVSSHMDYEEYRYESDVEDSL